MSNPARTEPDDTDRDRLHLLVDAIPRDHLKETAQVLVWLRDEDHRTMVTELIQTTQEAARRHSDAPAFTIRRRITFTNGRVESFFTDDGTGYPRFDKAGVVQDYFHVSGRPATFRQSDIKRITGPA